MSSLSHILVLCYEYPPIGGGGGRVAQQLAQQWADMGMVVDVITSAPPGAIHPSCTQEAQNLQVHRLPVGRKNTATARPVEMLRYITRATKYALTLHEQNPSQVCCAHFLIPTGVVARRLFQGTGLPYIAVAHGSDVPGHNPRWRAYERFTNPLWHTVVHHARAIIAPGEDKAARIRTLSPTSDVLVVPHGIDTHMFHPGEKENIILLAGRMVKEKNMDTALRVLARVERTGWKIVIAGDGAEKEALHHLVQTLGFTDNTIEWLGFVPPQELAQYYARAAIFLTLSTVESFNLTIAEALASGCRVLASDIPAHRAYTDAVSGTPDALTLVDPDDETRTAQALTTLMQYPPGTTPPPNSAPWEDIARRYRHVLESALL